MEKLKCCPFCGGKAVFHTISNNSTHYSCGFLFEIECKDCGIKLPSKYTVEFSLTEDGKVNILNDLRTQAIRTWNMRENEELKELPV